MQSTKNLSQKSIESLRTATLFEVLNDDQLEVILQNSRQITLTEGAYLFQQGDAMEDIFLCVSGYLKLFRLTDKGTEKVIDIVGPGVSFAESVMFMQGRCYPVHSVALKQAVVVAIRASSYLEIMRSSVDLCFNLMADMSRRTHWLLNEVDRLTLHNATFRLVTYLLQTHQPKSRLIRLDLPKHIIASRLSIKPETLSRILKRLSDQGYIAMQEDHIEILELSALEEIIKI